MMNKCSFGLKNAPLEREFGEMSLICAKNAALDHQLKPSLRHGRQMVNLCPVIFDLK
jgi:hypothetical protein